MNIDMTPGALKSICSTVLKRMSSWPGLWHSTHPSIASNSFSAQAGMSDMAGS